MELQWMTFLPMSVSTGSHKLLDQLCDSTKRILVDKLGRLAGKVN